MNHNAVRQYHFLSGLEAIRTSLPRDKSQVGLNELHRITGMNRQKIRRLLGTVIEVQKFLQSVELARDEVRQRITIKRK